MRSPFFSFLIQNKETVLIPQSVKYQIENPQQEKVVLIEVRPKTYLVEDDIVYNKD